MQRFIGTVLALLFFLSCSDKKENGIVFKEELPAKEDATKAWLHKVEHYKKNKNYLVALYQYYNQKIKAEEYQNAAEILDIACVYLADSYDFNAKFVATIQDFDAKYRAKVPALKTTFVDSYFANYYYDKYDLEKAAEYFKKVASLEPDDYSSCYNIARAYYDLSYVYYITGKQNLSLEANQKSFQYFSKINNAKGLAFVYSNYANIYTAIGDKKRAIENADKAIKAYKNIDNIYNVYIGLINKISIYDYLKDSRKEALIDSVYQDFQSSKDQSDILKIKIYDFKIENLVQQNRLPEAKSLLEKLKLVVEKINSDDLTQEYKVTDALYKMKSDPSYSDFEDIEKALPNLKENQQYEKVNMFYNVLQSKAIQNQDYKKALQYESEKKSIADSIGNIETRVKIAELETKYQTQKKVQEIQFQKQTISKKNFTIILLVSVFVVLVLVLMIYFLKQKQKKLKIEKTQSEQFTKQLLDKTEEERKRIATDLHDSVSHELLNLKNTSEQNHEELNSKIDLIINDIRAISRNLHPVLFEKVGLQSSMEQLVDRIQNNHDFMITTEIEYHQTLSKESELQLYRIVQEAVSNIIKYSDAIAAKVTLKENQQKITLEIIDNGKGFSVEETLHTKDSFGLHNIFERSKAIGGIAQITSNEKGTKIVVEIKK